MGQKMIRVAIVKNRIHLKLPFYLKDRAKLIPGYRWDKKKKTWTYPATASVAINLMNEFPEIESDEEFGKLKILCDGRKIAKRLLEIDELQEARISNGESWYHQKQAYHFIYALWGCGVSKFTPNGGVLLAYDMGTGKTRVAIQLIENLKLQKVLILCPKSVVDVWPEQIEKHIVDYFKYRAFIFRKGSIKERAENLEHSLYHPDNHIFVVNYDAAWREDLAEVITSTNWDLVILDEAHRIKSPNSKISWFCSKLGDKVPLRLAMTGTPLPHSPLDAYAMYRFLDKGIFGTSFAKFKDKHAIMGGFENKQVVAFRNLDELHNNMYSIAIRVTKEECLDLPELSHNRLTCTLSDKAKKIYDDLEQTLYAELETGEVTASNALVKLLRLQQLTSGHIKDDEGNELWVDDSKEKLLEDFLSDINKKEPIVVFCRFKTDLRAVHRVSKKLKRNSLELSGKINQLKEWWQTSKKGTIIAVQIKSGGVGIDLTRSCYAFYYSVGFSLADYLQSISRLHRPGQKKNVSCYHLVATNTVDEKVYKALDKREKIIESVLGEQS